MSDPVIGQETQGGEIHRAFGQPHPDRGPAEPPLEVAQSPADLDPPIGRGREWQDRVMEGLREAIDATVAFDEPAIRDRIAVLKPARQGRSEIPRHVTEIADLGVRPIALGADAGRPVVCRRGRRVRRHPTAERVGPRRLVEVAVDDEAASAHVASDGAIDAGSSSARSWVVATALETVIVRVAPGVSDSGHESSSPAPW